MPQLTSLPTAQVAENFDFNGKTAVVIDVLRATSVITTALANGAASVYPAGSIAEAWAVYHEGKNQGLVCGEKDAIKIDGFHSGNSPLEFSPEQVAGKQVILLTSNGTRAIRACKQADNIILLSFLNLEAVAGALQQISGPVVLVCSGTNGAFSLDDALCAGMLINHLNMNNKNQICDLSQTLSIVATAANNGIHEALKHCFHLQYLRNKGFGADVDFCLRTGVFDLVPVWKDGIVVRRENP